MNIHESFGLKNRRKTELINPLETKLNISTLKHYKQRKSISLKKVNRFEDIPQNNSLIDSISSKKSSFLNTINNKMINYNDNNYEKKPHDILNSKTQKLFKRYTLMNNKDNLIKNKKSRNSVNIMNRSSISDLNIIENNIKSIIRKMKNEIEKKVKKPEISNSVTPQIINNKLCSSPNLEIYFTKKIVNKSKRKKMRGSLLIEECHITEFSKSVDKKYNIKRSHTFNYSKQAKKKIFKKIKKIKLKNYSTKYINTLKNNSFDNDSDYDENYKGFAILPTSNFIFTFDLLLIIANLYTFIFFPLNFAHNRDIRNKESIIKEIIHYIIDLIYICDFIISFFRGYYNYEMNIIKNNKKIVLNYLRKDFISDLLEAIPIFSLIRIFMKSNDNLYSYNSERVLKFITIVLFIKPFKIFKIIRKKHNRALEDFYSYLSESYYLEQLAKFLIYFFIFFLFVHLFICLHIYFAFQSYPNWIIHTNIINDSFFAKYITSLYFMITTMTTVGYGDIVCISFIERIYHIILLFIGTLLYTFLVSKIGNYLRDESHERIKLNKDLNILENIRISCPTMSFKLYNKIKNHLLSIYKKRKKTGISYLINGVPDTIKNDLLFKIYSNVINEFIIFKNVKNSSFIIQVLTSFIPIISKKEEIIILEGELIQNIVFVKDGRLSMEIAIDLNNPVISIKNYLENNFIGISRQEELKNHNLNEILNTILNTKKNSYNELISKIDNIISNNQQTIINNNSIYNNHGISVDLGRLDFERNETMERDNDNFQIIKIIDIRKNEYYGDIHIFLEHPSPFTLKTKSRVADLFLLPKLDAMSISKNFPNIWTKIENKSYHNLVSIKKLTFKILKKFYNNNINNKNNKDSNINFNLDSTKNSELSFLERKPSFINILKTRTINRSMKLSNNIENKKNEYNNKNNNLNKNKLNVEYNNKKKNIVDSFEKDLNLLDGSINSNNSNFPNSDNYSDHKKEKSDIKQKRTKNLEQIDKKKTLDKNFSFKFDENNKNNILSPKKGLTIKNKSTQSKFKNNNEQYNNKRINKVIKDERNSKNSINDYNISHDSYKYYEQKTEEIIKDYNDLKIITLEDINHNFSSKIKKKIKKRKVIEKLKQLLKSNGLKINKNLYDLYLRHNSINKSKSNENTELNSLSYSISSLNNKILSKILDSSFNEDINLSTTKNKKLVIKQSFKKIKVESFEIKSSYKNINVLTNGEIIKNKKYKSFIENLIKKNINKNISNNSLISIISNSTKQENIKETSLTKSKKEKGKNKEDGALYSEGKNSTISKMKLKKFISDELKNISSKKFCYQNTDQNTENNCVTIEDKKLDQKIKTSSKFFEKNIENKNTIKKMDLLDRQNEDVNNIDNNSIHSNNIINNIEGKQLYISKKSNSSNQKKNNNNIFFRDLFDKKKNNNSKIENLLFSQNHNNSFTRMIKMNNNDEEKTKICSIY